MKTSWHRYETKLRHCRPMYTIYNFWSRNILKTGEAKFHVLQARSIHRVGHTWRRPNESILYACYTDTYFTIGNTQPWSNYLQLSLLQQFPTAFARKVIKSAVYKACSQQSVSQSVKTLIQVDKPQRDKVK